MNREPGANPVALRGIAGFDLWSLAMLLALATTYTFVFGNWKGIILAQDLRDFLLWAIWFVMTVLSCWNVRPARDLALAASGGLGGFFVEWWGTHSEAWFYFTRERPPLFILPAWMISTVVISRVGEQLAPRLPASRRLDHAYWAVLLGFIAWMTVFVWPFFHLPATWVFVAMMLAVPWVGRSRDPRMDLALFLVGVFAGVFFEYWGTSRRCWTYYTGEAPPVIAVLAHGFSAVAFNHLLDFARKFLKSLK